MILDSISRRLSSDHTVKNVQQKLFNLQQELYDEGARNFLFIDVPPMELSPAWACEPIPSSLTKQTLIADWKPSRRMLGSSLARRTKDGMEYFGGTSKPSYRKTRMLRRWFYPRGTFSNSSSKRLPSTGLKRGTSASGTDLCGPTISILLAACMSSSPRGSADS